MRNKIRIIIIGANSYIARNFIYYLYHKYKDILDILLYDKDIKHLDNYSSYHSINLLDKQSLEKINFNCDFIYLFSGITGTMQGFSEYELFVKLNELGLLNVLDYMRHKKSKAVLIFPSTRLVYKGVLNKKLDEDATKEFKSIYAINKFACEQYLKLFQSLYDINYTIFRICVPYGSLISRNKSYGTISNFLEKASNGDNIIIYGDGQQKRTFIYIGDLCEALYEGAISGKCNNDVFNIGGADCMSIYDAALGIAKLFKVNVRSSQWPADALSIETGDTIFCSRKFDSKIMMEYKTNYREWLLTESLVKKMKS